VGEVANKLPRCSDVMLFAEKLAVALAPLRELVEQERLEVSVMGLYARVARELVVTRFGEPGTELAGSGPPVVHTLIYKCVHEGGGEDVVVVDVVESEWGASLVAYTAGPD
jgi:hypothetical protein